LHVNISVTYLEDRYCTLCRQIFVLLCEETIVDLENLTEISKLYAQKDCLCKKSIQEVSYIYLKLKWVVEAKISVQYKFNTPILFLEVTTLLFRTPNLCSRHLHTISWRQYAIRHILRYCVAYKPARRYSLAMLVPY
jgi:hypothetical protein